jgi:hypothetical protein
MSRRFASGPAMARAMTSLLPPGEKGTTILIVFGSVTCAAASAVNPTTARRNGAANKASRDPSVRMASLPNKVIDSAIVSGIRDVRPRARTGAARDGARSGASHSAMIDRHPHP